MAPTRNRRAIGALVWTILLVGPAGPGSIDAQARPQYPLSVDADGRHVVDETGREIFFHLESAWFLVGRLNREDTLRYFEDRKARGFNGMLLQFPLPLWFDRIENAYGEPPFLVPGDFSTPNEAYFAHADWVVEQAYAHGLTLFLAPAYLGWECEGSSQSGGFCPDMLTMGADGMREWGRWIGARYRDHPNIVWIHGGDANAADHGAAALVDAVAEGIREVDPGHLHTAFCNRYHSAADCYDRPWLDLNSTYGDCGATPALLRADYLREPVRPFFFIEGRYEFHPEWTDVCMRSQAWWSLLSGAFGQVFGIMDVHAFDPGWEEHLDSPGSRAMVHFRRFVDSRDWERLEPDHAGMVLVSGAGDIDGPDYAAAARARDGSFLVVYCPTPRPLVIDLAVVSDESANAWWFDPVDGTVQFIDRIQTGAPREFTPPPGQDRVLVIDAEWAGYPSPGTVGIRPVRRIGTIKRQYRRR